MAEELQLPSDRQLIDAARAGSTSAWPELRARHERVVDAVARERGSPDSIAVVFDELEHHMVDEDADAGAGVLALRPRAISILTGGTYSPQSLDATDAPADEGPVAVPERRSDGFTGAELVMLATAFGRLSERWQTVLWHQLVDLEPAATTSAVLGGSPTDTVALASTAAAGLFDAFIATELDTDGAVAADCRRTVGLLGAYRRGTLPDAQRRDVAAHLEPVGCSACHRRLALADQFGVALPAAVVPGLTGLAPDRYRSAIGAVALLGTSALAAQRSARANRWARVGAVAAIVIALLGAATLIRSPFDDLDGEIADLLEQMSTTTTTVPSSPAGTLPPGAEQLPSRVELVFPGVPQGVIYVPGGPSQNLSMTLSTPAPVFRNGTATIDAAITNDADTAVTSRFTVRMSPGVSFDALTEGGGRCEPSDDVGAVCVVDIDAGAVAPLSLRFTLDAAVSQRLVVVSSLGPSALDLPIETVPGLVVGTVARGRLATVGNTLGSCDPGAAECPAAGDRSASGAVLDLAPDTEIDSATLLWRGDDAPSVGPSVVGLIVPGQSNAETIDAAESGLVAAGRVEFSADVTELVRRGGEGRYTVVRPPSLDDLGDGSWTLVVVTREPTAPRRLFVAIDPRQPATPTDPVVGVIPVESPAPAGPPRSPIRPLTLQLAVPSGTSGALVDVDGLELPTPDGPTAGPLTYDLGIDAEASTVEVTVAASTRPVHVAAIGLAIDIVT